METHIFWCNCGQGEVAPGKTEGSAVPSHTRLGFSVAAVSLYSQARPGVNSQRTGSGAEGEPGHAGYLVFTAEDLP